MRVLVSGGTGTIGNLLIENLLKSNHEPIVITRNISRVKNSWKDKVEFVEADLSSLSSKSAEDLEAIISTIDGIINLIGESVFAKRWTKKQKERLYDSRVVATRNLVNIVKSVDNKPKVFISVSGTDIYPPNDESKVYSEEDDEVNQSFLGTLSRDWEQPVKSLTEIRSVIFRMGVAFTYSGNAAERMFLPHKFFVGGWIGSGKQIYSWIHIKDFTGLLQWALENEKVNGIYNGVAPEYLPMKGLAKTGGKIMGRWTWTWAPGFVLKILLGERAEILLKGRAVSSEKVISEGYKFKFPDAKSALKDILLHKP